MNTIAFPVRRLQPTEVQRRAVRIRLVLTDVDGTLTDGSVYYSARGEEMKRFNLRDGMGVERLRQAGVETAMITREHSPIVQRRAEKLRVPVYGGLRDKAAAFPDILTRAGVDVQQVAYIGDDLNDVPLMRIIVPSGLVSAPADALPQVLNIAHHVCALPGGHGAFRDFAEWLIRLRSAGGEETA